MGPNFSENSSSRSHSSSADCRGLRLEGVGGVDEVDADAFSRALLRASWYFALSTPLIDGAKGLERAKYQEGLKTTS